MCSRDVRRDGEIRLGVCALRSASRVVKERVGGGFSQEDDDPRGMGIVVRWARWEKGQGTFFFQKYSRTRDMHWRGSEAGMSTCV
jgi:hypothetical protein